MLLQLGEIGDEVIQANVVTRIFQKIALVSDEAQRQQLQNQLLRQVYSPLPSKLKARLLTGLVETLVSLTDKAVRTNRLA